MEVLEEGTFVTAYDFPNGTSILLVVNRALARKGQSTSLISPFIMRTAGIIVNDIGDSEAHSIIVPDRGYKLDLELIREICVETSTTILFVTIYRYKNHY